MPAQAIAHRSQRHARLSSIIKLEGTMRVTFSLPPLLVAGAALGGLLAPLAVGGARPTA